MTCKKPAGNTARRKNTEEDVKMESRKAERKEITARAVILGKKARRQARREWFRIYRDCFGLNIRRAYMAALRQTMPIFDI